MKPDKWIEFDCVQAHQPIGTFYIGAIPCKDVFRIAKADVHRIDDRDIEEYIGIQRELKPKRVKEIAEYADNADATFPTAILLAIDSKNAKYNASSRRMKIRDDSEVAQIIDGQHRIAGLENFKGQFDLNVAIFIDMDLQDKAMTFATINLSQTKVNRSLGFNLYSFQKQRSPQKTCHLIARMLHQEEKSPLKGRIKILGRATGEDFQYITQATVIESLMPYISPFPDIDRKALRKKKALPEVPESKSEQLIFREYFKTGNDELIGSVVWNLFEAVEKRWPEAWNESERGYVLNRTTGFTAIMRFLGPLYRKYNSNGKLSAKSIQNILSGIPLEFGDFTTDNYKPGSQGSTSLFHDFLESL